MFYRKRAKTEAEKEQRRIERVIRNRLAAHSSRERKRKEVECLEDAKSVIENENDRLRKQLVIYVNKNHELMQEVRSLRAELGRPVDGPETKSIKQEPLSSYPSPPQSNASHVDVDDSYEAASPPSPEFHDFAASTDMTQHPAEML